MERYQIHKTHGFHGFQGFDSFHSIPALIMSLPSPASRATKQYGKQFLRSKVEWINKGRAFLSITHKLVTQQVLIPNLTVPSLRTAQPVLQDAVSHGRNLAQDDMRHSCAAW